MPRRSSQHTHGKAVDVATADRFVTDQITYARRLNQAG